MKIDVLERLYEDARETLPDILKVVQKRRIICPPGYLDPKYFSLSEVGSIFALADKKEEEVTQFDKVLGLVTNNLIYYDTPTYFVEPSFCSAALATEPPKDFTISEIKFPMPSMLLVLPQCVVNQILPFNIPFIAVSKMEKGNHPLSEAFRSFNFIGCEAGMFAVCFPVIPKSGLFIWYSGWFPSSFDLGTLDSNMDLFIDDTQMVKDEIYRNHPGDERWANLMEEPERKLDKEEDQNLIRQVQSIAIKIVMAATSLPKYISGGGVARKARVKNGRLVREELWNPIFIGKGYTIKRVREDGQGTHASPKMHWRKGHWHHVVHGVGRSLRKLNWFEPVLVNSERS